MIRSALILSALTSSVLGCAKHDNHHYPETPHKKRAEAGESRDWEYATSYDWGSLNLGGIS